MRIQTKGVLAAAGVVSLTSMGIAGTNIASAMSNTSSERQSSLVDAIAKKFNLNTSDVQKVFDEQREAHHDEMKAERLDNLKQALTDKKITQSQYDYIVTAWKDIDSVRDASKNPRDMTDEQRDAVRTKMKELRSWMKEQDITLKDIGLSPKSGHGAHHGHDRR